MRITSPRAAGVLAAAALTSTLAVPVAAASASTPDWKPCPQSAPVPGAVPIGQYRCAVAEVPLSYRDSDGQRIRIALGKLPAADQPHKLGTIFYNPGGPGNPGRIPPALTPQLHERFDIVGFDPRGVGASTSLHCLRTPADAAPLVRTRGNFPGNQRQRLAQIRDMAAIDATCARNAGPLLHHMSTANVARDLDRLRALLGEEKLNFYGISYGTMIGQTYANLFPGRVGAVALDAVDDPVGWTTGDPGMARQPLGYRLDAHLGGGRALGAFFDACAADRRCAFRGGDPRQRYDAILDRLHRTPLRISDPGTGKPTVLRYQDFVGRVHNALTDAENSPVLASLLVATEHGTPAPPPPSPQPNQPLHVYESALGGGATLCADIDGPRNPLVWQRFADRADRQARGFGSYSTYLSLPCALWPSGDADRYTGPWNRKTANPLLLIGNRQGDPETPYTRARRAQRHLGNARLLALDSFGHGSRGRSACVDGALDAYFTAGRMPAPDAVCAPDRGPFDTPPVPGE